MKITFIAVFFTCLTAWFPISCRTEGRQAATNNTKTTINNEKRETSAGRPVRPDTLTITAVGDIMLGSAYPSPKNLPPDDAVSSFNSVASYLKGDVIFGNLEGCFLDKGDSNKCKDIDPTRCYAFRMPGRYAAIIKKAGFNVLSIANNHIGDFENAGRRNTARILDSLKIQYAGQRNKPYALFEKDGLRYAFCAFAPNENTLPLNQTDSAKILVASLKRKADIVIVSFHGGGEGKKYEHITRQPERFYNENRGNVYAFAHAVIDAGADVVLGHGPHVTRAVEVYKNKFIAYSLGNFCTYGRFNLDGPNGIAPIIRLKVTAKGDFIKANVISVKQDKIRRLQPDPKHAAFHKIKQLSDADFKGHRLLFSGNDEITLKP